MFLYIFVISIISAIAWYQLNYRRRNELLAKIPSPRTYPIIRNTLEFYGKTPKDLFKSLQVMKNSLGSIYQFTLHPYDDAFVVISDPKMTEEVLSSQKIINKSDDYELMKGWLGTGLLISTGRKWHQRRKILTPSFHFQILDKFVEIMDEQGKVLVKKLELLEGQEVDICPLINHYALDVICESAMGFKMNAQNQDSDYTEAVKGISELIYERSFDTFRRIDFIYQFTEMYQTEKRYLKVLHGFTDGVIKARREELILAEKLNEAESNEASGIKRKMALLDMLLQATIDGKPLSNEDIREEVDTFMFGGHDTTTSGISFCLYNIAKYPEVQQKIFDEIEQEIGDERSLSVSHLSNLHYLELVIKESLRLYPSVPYFSRKLTEETTIGSYVLPQGSNISLSPFLMGRDPEIFPDPLDFKPERFNVETTSEKVNPYAYVPFSAGPRNCIGQKFAVLEMKSSICKIIRNFELSISKKNAELDIYGDMVLKSTGGIVVKINRRE